MGIFMVLWGYWISWVQTGLGESANCIFNPSLPCQIHAGLVKDKINLIHSQNIMAQAARKTLDPRPRAAYGLGGVATAGG